MNEDDKVLWWIVNLLTGAVMAGLAWWNNDQRNEMKELRRRLHDQQNEIAKLQILVVGDYVKQEKFDDSIKAITETMTRGFDKIDSKMDDIYEELKHKVDKP